MYKDGIVQHSLKFRDTAFPYLTRHYLNSGRGNFTEWLCHLAESTLTASTDTQLDRIEHKLDAILSGGVSIQNIPQAETLTDEPEELADALSSLGL